MKHLTSIALIALILCLLAGATWGMTAEPGADYSGADYQGYVFNDRGGVDTVAAARHVIFTDTRTADYHDYEWYRPGADEDWHNMFDFNFNMDSPLVDDLVSAVIHLQYTEQLTSEPADIQPNSALPNSNTVLWCTYMSFWRYHTPLESGVMWQACAVQETDSTAIVNVNDERLDHLEIYRTQLADAQAVFEPLGG